MQTNPVWLLITLLLNFSLLLIPEGSAQTCCTGSAPITGSIQISQIDSKQWNINVIADHNYIGDLFIEDEEIQEDLIIRATNTVLLQTNYGLTNRLSASIVLPFVNKWEETQSNKVSKTAFGDLSLLLQYSLINKKSYSVIVGSGIKFPTGPTQLTDPETQIIIQPSLQPGTGSYDFLFLTQFQYAMPFRHSMSIAQSFSYQLAGTGKNFASHDAYKFGNEFQSFTSISDQFVWLNKIFTPSITLRISQRATNIIEVFEDVNSGGTWGYLSPGTTVKLNSTLSLMVQADMPVYRNINGFQLVPSYVIRGGVLILI
jgi:hypothetical protein